MREFPPRAIFYESVDSLCEAFGHTPEEMHGYLEAAGYSINTVTSKGIEPVADGAHVDLTDFVATRA